MDDVDCDLCNFSKDQLVEEIVKLQKGIRKHRDSSLHELCWHHPDLWSLLPEKVEPEIVVSE